MERGWFKFWRKAVDSEVFQDAHLLQLWIWCLSRANWKKNSIPVKTGRGQTVVTLQPGQFLYGRKAAAASLRCAGSTVRDRMKSLKQRQMIDITPTTHYSIVTVLNWEAYQDFEDEGRQVTRQETRQATATQPTPNRHREEGLEGKDGKEIKDLPPSIDGRPLGAAVSAKGQRLGQQPTAKVDKFQDLLRRFHDGKIVDVEFVREYQKISDAPKAFKRYLAMSHDELGQFIAKDAELTSRMGGHK